MKTRILYTKPSITELEIRYATNAVTSGWGENCYEYISLFEKKFKEHLGVKHAISTSSCTGALHMGLAALGIRAGDEVIIADTNWIASAAPIVYLGATPVFVDVENDTWCIDPDKLEASITPRTKAILAVHLYGNPCNMTRLLELSKKYNLFLIEDSAEAIGTIIHGKRAGSIGNFGTFSFHGSKTITTGEGGMFVTNDTDLYEHVLSLSNHGRVRGQRKQFWPEIIGFKYKMSNIQAAIGCAQIERIEDLIERKRKILSSYRERVNILPGATMNPEPLGTINGSWMPTVVFEPEMGITRELMQAAFSSENIDARVFFWPLSSLPSFTPKPQNIIAWSLPGRSINLPSFYDIKDSEIERVVSVLEQLVIARNFKH